MSDIELADIAEYAVMKGYPWRIAYAVALYFGIVITARLVREK